MKLYKVEVAVAPYFVEVYAKNEANAKLRAEMLLAGIKLNNPIGALVK